MKPIVVVDSVSKKYSRNANSHRSYGITDLWREIFGRPPSLTLRKDEFLAVDDVSLHMLPGDTLGLIGRNGSGKTTLLKMMNGLVKPDAGSIMMRGRIQALINLGAGFNPSLSGRDNIFNSAALMGFNRKETNGILDAIIAFSDLEEFIDSPIGTYSSGMRARLGFAVAINLRPDILLIDEILSVGDYAFQNRCFKHMQQFKSGGGTIVLVSHSHNSVIQLCDRALWLHRGRTQKFGPSKEVVTAYLESVNREELERVQKANKQRGEKATSAEEPAVAPKATDKKPKDPYDGLYGPIFDEFDRIADLEVSFKSGGAESDCVRLHDDVEIAYAFTLCRRVDDLNVTLKFFRKDGLNLTTISTLNGDLVRDIHEGRVRCACRIPDFSFNPGAYVLVIAVHEGKSYLYRNVIKEFAVVGNGRLSWGISDLPYSYNVEQAS